MRNQIQESAEYAELAAEVIEEHGDLHWIENMVSVGYFTSSREKKKSGRAVLGECILVREPYTAFTPYDFLIIIYSPNVCGLTRDQKKILMRHELLHIGMKESEEEPDYIVVPHDIEDFRAIISRYGIDWAEKGGG